ncbi:MAG: hypothetical protein IPJ90_23000 [Anaerolineaceae bacterium]|nr:hypothetical protein [Anaerolineaceae bacterium]
MSTPTANPHSAMLNTMQTRLHQWQQTADRRAIFLNCYLLMTENMLTAVHQQQFQDNPWVHTLTHRFADYYFTALAAYESQQPTTPQVWQLTFTAALDAQTYTLQNLFLGVNAHINYDLVLTVVELLEAEWAALSPAERTRRYQDFIQVNEIIARTVDAVQDTVVEAYTPRLDWLDRLMGPVDEWLVSKMIGQWREEVWQTAVILLNTPTPAQREPIHKEMEARALKIARMLLAF